MTFTSFYIDDFWFTLIRKKTWRFSYEISRFFGLHFQTIWLD